MKLRQFITLVATVLSSALTCPAATLIVDSYVDDPATQATGTDSSLTQIGFEIGDLRQDARLAFFGDVGIELSSPEPFEGLWFLTGFITLDSADFHIDSPLVNADIAGASASTPPAICNTCSRTAAQPSPQTQDQPSRVAYTLVMTSFPTAAEGVYTNAVQLNRKEARQPYAILMLPGGLAAVESGNPR